MRVIPLEQPLNWAFGYSFGDRDMFERRRLGFSLVTGYGNDVRAAVRRDVSETHVFSPALSTISLCIHRVFSFLQENQHSVSSCGMPELSQSTRTSDKFITLQDFPLGQKAIIRRTAHEQVRSRSGDVSRGRPLENRGMFGLYSRNAFLDGVRGLLQFSPFGQITSCVAICCSVFPRDWRAGWDKPQLRSKFTTFRK